MQTISVRQQKTGQLRGGQASASSCRVMSDATPGLAHLRATGCSLWRDGRPRPSTPGLATTRVCVERTLLSAAFIFGTRVPLLAFCARGGIPRAIPSRGDGVGGAKGRSREPALSKVEEALDWTTRLRPEPQQCLSQPPMPLRQMQVEHFIRFGFGPDDSDEVFFFF